MLVVIHHPWRERRRADASARRPTFCLASSARASAARLLPQHGTPPWSPAAAWRRAPAKATAPPARRRRRAGAEEAPEGRRVLLRGSRRRSRRGLLPPKSENHAHPPFSAQVPAPSLGTFACACCMPPKSENPPLAGAPAPRRSRRFRCWLAPERPKRLKPPDGAVRERGRQCRSRRRAWPTKREHRLGGRSRVGFGVTALAVLRAGRPGKENAAVVGLVGAGPRSRARPKAKRPRDGLGRRPGAV